MPNKNDYYADLLFLRLFQEFLKSCYTISYFELASLTEFLGKLVELFCSGFHVLVDF